MPNHPKRCHRKDCPKPQLRANDPKGDRHRKRYHQETVTVDYNGQKRTLSRDPMDGKFHCPCGSENHARASADNIRLLCSRKCHPHALAVGDNPDSDDDDGPSTLPLTHVASGSLDTVDPHTANENHEEEPQLADMPQENGPDHFDPVTTLIGYAPPFSQSVDAPEAVLYMPEEDLEEIPAPGEFEPMNDGHRLPDDNWRDEGEGEDMDVDVEVDVDEARRAGEQPNVAAEAHHTLLIQGIDVNPTYRWIICIDCAARIQFDVAYKHFKSHRARSRARDKFPSRSELQHLLTILKADSPLPSPTTPVPQIPSLQVVDAVRCMMSTSCSQVFSHQKRLSDHRRLQHPGYTGHIAYVAVKAHPTSLDTANRRYIEILPQNDPPSSNLALSAVLQNFKDLGIGRPLPTFQRAKNARIRTPFVAKTNWDQPLVDVELAKVRKTVAPPDTKLEPHLVRLKPLVRQYYVTVGEALRELQVSHLTLRHIRSADPNKDLKNDPFRRLQEKNTALNYADFSTTFTIFLIRNLQHPIPGFLVEIDQDPQVKLDKLVDLLKNEAGETLATTAFHEFTFSLLTHPSAAFLANQWKDPLLQFLVVYHLSDDRGTFRPPRLVTPNFSKIQWSLRATAAFEIILRKRQDCDADCFRIYNEHVRPYLITGKQSMFNLLREQISLVSSIAHEEPGLPRFCWDITMTTLTIDGHAIPLWKIRESIHSVIELVEQQLKGLFRGCLYSDILKYVDSRQDLNPEMWFQDRPQDDTYGTSIFSIEQNGLGKYWERLLTHMVGDERYFTNTSSGPTAKRENVATWFSDLDALQPQVFFLVSATAGGARGAEMEGLSFKQHQGNRSLYFLNGILTLVTTYVKTQSIHGRGRMIARALPWKISRLLLLLYGVVYPTASRLAAFVYRDKELAEAYETYMFIYGGEVVDSPRFSKFLGWVTEQRFGYQMGLRDWRQTLCTIMVNVGKVDFSLPDDEDEDLKLIHDLFAHSAGTAAQHYTLQLSQALREISHTAVAANQRVSIQFHSILGLDHPTVPRDSTKPSGPAAAVDWPKVEDIVDPVTRSVAKICTEIAASNTDTLIRHITNGLQGFGSELIKTMASRPSSSPQTPPAPTTPPLQVHPRLIELVRSLLPSRPEQARFSSPQQAEAVQSNPTNRHVLYIAPTGSGKSLTFFSAPLLEPGKMFIVITPLIALTDDLARRLAATSIEGGEWQNVLRRNPLQARLVLVSAHEAGHHNFHKWAKTHKERIGRIFIDEAHHLITAQTYRDCFKLFELMTALGIPFTFLSATLFPKSVPALCQRMRIDPTLLHVIRTPTPRANIKYTRTKCNSMEEMMDKLQDLFRSINLSEKERGLIFCTKVANCQEVAKRLGISYYVANIIPQDPVANLEERKRLDQQWRDGRTASERWMVATLCFGQGINVDHVRWVIHVEVSNLMNYAQETGRAGRDGLPARAHLFYTHLPPLQFIQDPLDHEGVRDMRHFLEAECCRRLLLHTPTDGTAHSCAALAGALLCDWCDVWYQSGMKDLPGLPQPLNFGLPLIDGEDGTIRPSISVQSNAAKINQEHQAGCEELRQLERLLDNILQMGCVDCYFWAGREPKTHPHQRHADFLLKKNSFRAIKYPAMLSWPFCYLCLVPYRVPCNHPPHAPNQPADPEMCPHRDILPDLLVLIWLDDDNRRKTIDQLADKDLKVSQHQNKFMKWLAAPPRSTTDIPNLLRFFLAYNRIPRAERG